MKRKLISSPLSTHDQPTTSFRREMRSGSDSSAIIGSTSIAAMSRSLHSPRQVYYQRQQQQPPLAALPSTSSTSQIPHQHAKMSLIHPLGNDSYARTLTPRSMEKNKAELDALRSRVQELEQKLAQVEVMDEMLSPTKTKASNRLPPISNFPSNMSEHMSGLPADGQVVLPVIVPFGSPLNPHLQSMGEGDLCDTIQGKARENFKINLPSNATVSMDTNCTSSPTSEASRAPLETSNIIENSRSTLKAVQENSRSACTSHTLPEAEDKVTSHSTTNLMTTYSSPPKDEAKIMIGQEGDVVFAISQRTRLYQVLKRISGLITIKEDDLVIMKKLVDAEFGDAIKLLLELENEQDPIEVERRVSHFFETGSPSKLKMALGFSSRTNANADRPCSQPHPIWGINYPLQKIARNLEQLKGIPSKTEVVVLVSSGAYNPIHMLHLRAFYVARQHIEANYKFPVVGAMFSPSHDTYVRVKNRRTPREMIPRKHRLALMEAAVQTSTWIEVDKWEITRRRVLDYLSTLHHVREMCETHFPYFKCRLVYVCGVNTVVKLSHSALHQEGFGCLTVCRPSQTEMVMKHLGNKITKSTIVVEDTGVLPMELERATSFRVRKALVEHEKVSTLEAMVGKQVYAYMLQHGIDKKIAGKEPWSEEDKAWREIDIPYVEYTEG